MGGNAFLRFSSSVAAGALILPQVARAQECVKTYEGCGSCDNPNLRYLTVVSSSENLTTIQYTNCGSEPFSNAAILLEDINNDITTLRAGDNLNDCTGNDDVSAVSFPCVTESSLSVSFDGQQTSGLPRLEKIRFANLVTVGEFRIERMPALISISAPILQSASSFIINDNNLLPKIDFPSLSVVGGTAVSGDVRILENENLKKISLPSLTETGANSNSFFDVLRNPILTKLCASKLESVGLVCIGNDQNQPFLDADLSELVTGSFFPSTVCSDSNAANVCGAGGTTGLFSDTDGCPSNACS